MAEKTDSIFSSPARKMQFLMGEEVDGMSDKEQLMALVDQYISLQRIKTAEDRDKEIDYQLRTVRAKLEAYGIMTEKLDIV